MKGYYWILAGSLLSLIGVIISQREKEKQIAGLIRKIS